MTDEQDLSGATDEDEKADVSAIPDELCELGREVWQKVAPVLTALGRLKRSDVFSFSRYCELNARFITIAKDIQDRGEVIEVWTYGKGKNDPNSTMVLRPHPLLKDYRSLATELRQQDREYGMTPKSRAEMVSRELAGLGAGGGGGDLFEDGEDEYDGANPITFN